jgi:hypothetical protein
MNKRRRFKAKRRREARVWERRFANARTYDDRRRALLWLRANAGMVWP